MKDEEKILNWSEISRLLTGNRVQIRADYNGKKYKRAVSKLRGFIKIWLKNYAGENKHR